MLCGQLFVRAFTVIKKGPQEVKNHKSSAKNSLKSFKPSEMPSLSNSRLQNCKQCTNQSSNNGDMFEKTKRDVSEEESVTSI